MKNNKKVTIKIDKYQDKENQKSFRQRFMFKLLDYSSLLASFLVFNIFNYLFFYIMWTPQIPVFRLLYYVVLFVYVKYIYLVIAYAFIGKFLSTKKRAIFLKIRQQFAIFMVFYIMIYIGSKQDTYTTDQYLFRCYAAGCLVTSVIVFFIYYRKYDKYNPAEDEEYSQDKAK